MSRLRHIAALAILGLLLRAPCALAEDEQPSRSPAAQESPAPAAISDPAAPPPQSGLATPGPPAAAAAGERAREEIEAAGARALAHRDRLAALAADIAARREAEQTEHAAQIEEILGLAARVGSVADESADADALYGEIVGSLRSARPRLREALDALRAPTGIPAWSETLDPALRAAAPLADAVEAYDTLVAGFHAETERLLAEESAARWEAVDLRGAYVERLDALRIECLRKLSARKRWEILGFSEAGIAQLRREMDQVVLSARLYAARRGHAAPLIAERMRSVVRIGAMAWLLLELVAIVAVFVWLRRRWRIIVERSRLALFPRIRGFRNKRTLETALGAIEVIGPWTLFLVALRLTKGALGWRAELPEIAIPLDLAFVYGAYRLALDASYALTVRAAGRYRLRLDQARRSKIFASLRGVARLVAAIVVFLDLSSRFLGEGYLYHLVVRFAWIFGAFVAFRLLAAWRQEISDDYLKASPSGGLSDLVRRTRERWYGVFLGAASFGFLAGRAAAILARDFALGFDQTRKALAFLFRRRVERHAEQRGYAEARPEDLPPGLVKAFSEEPVSEGDLALPHFPGLDRLDRAIESWRRGAGGGSFLLSGEHGIGKTSWMGRVRAEGVEVVRVRLDDRPERPEALAEILSRAVLGGAARTSEIEGLAAALASGPPRIVTVDIAQNLFLSAVGGYRCFEGFSGLVEATARRVFWICSFNAFAWAHLAAVRPDLAVFRHHVSLPPWSEERIRQLIRARLAASGFTATYEDLVVDRMEGVSAEATLLQTEEGYGRLLWDYSDGNPRVALYCWLRSVHADGPDRVRVRLFRAPDPVELERGGEQGLFVLAAIVNHENLTLDESRRTTRYAESICRIHLDRLQEVGALQANDGRYRLTTLWQRPAIRLLKRRNLLPD